MRQAYYIELCNKRVTSLSQMAVLKCLLIKDRCSSKELAKAIRGHRTKIDSVCRRMKEVGLVDWEIVHDKKVSCHNFRVYFLTDAGRKIAETKLPK